MQLLLWFILPAHRFSLVYSASRINDTGQRKMWIPFSHHREPSTYWRTRGQRARRALAACWWLSQHVGTVSTTAVRQVWWVPEKMKGAERRESGRVTTLCFFFSFFLTLWRAKKRKGCKPWGHLGYTRSRGQPPTYTEFFQSLLKKKLWKRVNTSLLPDRLSFL